MGCICSKGLEDDFDETHSIKSLHHFLSLSRKEEVVAVIADVALNGSHRGSQIFMVKTHDDVVTASPKWSNEAEKKMPVVTERPRNVVGHQRRATVDIGLHRNVSEVITVSNDSETIFSMPNGSIREHIAAGWPSWLVSVAGEAVKGWLPRRVDSFKKLEKIGQGTYSSVYRARDLETQKIVALKKVRFVNMDPESVRFMAREIHILRKLDHPNVLKLEGIVTSQKSSNLYLVFEYMEHDLAGIAARPGVKFTEPEIKCYMRQLLEGLAHCHSRGVLHRDIKGSNILVDNNGVLRIGDFGLASFFDPEQKQPLTSRVVTLWYRPPELLLGATEYGVAVDLWSTGCILAELFAGKPIMPGRTEVEQMHKIFKLCGSPSEEYWKKAKLQHATIFKPQSHYRRCIAEAFSYLPNSALALLDTLLAIEPENRGTAASALDSEFFTTEPFACDPSSLTKYPASKEYDARLREEARRQRAEAAHGRESVSVMPERTDSKNIPATELQKRRGSQKFVVKDNIVMAIEQPEIGARNGFAHSIMHSRASALNNRLNHENRMAHSRAYSVRVPNGPQLKTQVSFLQNSGVNEFSNFPSSVARGSTTNFRYNELDITELPEKQERTYSTSKKDETTRSKDSTMAYGNRNKRIHYSGPLVPPGGSIEDLLKEHDRQIQEAARKARIDKVKTRKF